MENQKGMLAIEIFKPKVYDPHPHVCNKKQSDCQNSHCRLFPICSQTSKVSVPCKRDCASCTYEGCSLAENERKNAPIYLDGCVVASYTEYDQKTQYIKEQIKWKQVHQHGYFTYNCLFGDLLQKMRIHRQVYYQEHRKQILEKCRKSTDHSLLSVQRCEYDCFSCPFDDCIIPDVETKKDYMRLYYAQNHDKLLQQKAEYREIHRKELAQYSKEYYYAHHEELLQYHAEYREKHKAEQKTYDRKRRESPEYKEKQKEYGKKYRDTHREECRERCRLYMQRKRAKAREDMLTSKNE